MYGALVTLAFMNSHPASSATIVGTVKGNDNNTPFSVPTHRALWAGIRVETWIGMRLSLPNAVNVYIVLCVWVWERAKEREQEEKKFRERGERQVREQQYTCSSYIAAIDSILSKIYGCSISPSTLCTDGPISRSCIHVSVVPWKRRSVESNLNEIQTPSPTGTMWDTSAFLLWWTEKVDWRKRR